MSDVAAVLRAVAEDAGFAAPPSIRAVGGGTFSEVYRFGHDGAANAPPLAAKVTRGAALGWEAEEAIGLQALADTGTVRVPAVVAHRQIEARGGTVGVLLFEWLEAPAAPPGPDVWGDFGRALAALHAAPIPASARPVSGRYGFAVDNHLGATPQANDGTDDWPTFVATHRLRPLVAVAERRGLLTRPLGDRLDSLIERLPEILPAAPGPSLLHGDLWSGNALATRGPGGAAAIAVIDPAPSVGDGWADIAMMQLFGGFPAEVFAAYEAAAGRPDDAAVRIAVGQLHHALNHLVLFGAGYAGLVEQCVRAADVGGC